MSYKSPPYRRYGSSSGNGGGIFSTLLRNSIMGDPAEKDFAHQKELADIEGRQSEAADRRKYQAEAEHDARAKQAQAEKDARDEQAKIKGTKVEGRQARKTARAGSGLKQGEEAQKHDLGLMSRDGIMSNARDDYASKVGQHRLAQAEHEANVTRDFVTSGGMDQTIKDSYQALVRKPIVDNIKNGTTILTPGGSAVMPFGASGTEDKPSFATGQGRRERLVQEEGIKDANGKTIIPGKSTTLTETTPPGVRPIFDARKIYDEAPASNTGLPGLGYPGYTPPAAEQPVMPQAQGLTPPVGDAGNSPAMNMFNMLRKKIQSTMAGPTAPPPLAEDTAPLEEDEADAMYRKLLRKR